MLAKFKSYLESIEITPTSWLLGVSGILMARFFLESLSSRTSSGFFASDASTLLHYYLFFLSLAMVFMILLSQAVPSWRHIIPQLAAASLVLVFIAPIIDLLVSRGQSTMTYFFLGQPASGITLGIRIEVVLMVLFFGLLVYFLERKILRAVVFTVLLAIIICLFLSLPSVVSILAGSQDPLLFFQNAITGSSTTSNNIHSSLQYSSIIRFIEVAFNFIMAKILFLILVIFSSIWFYTNHKKKFEAVVQNSRPERIIHYFLLITLGCFLAYSGKLNWADWLSVVVLSLSFYFAWMFAVSTNDLADEDIDLISNPSRPLVKNVLSKADMKQAANLFLVATLISGYLAGYTTFFFVLTFTALYYIYSVPPTRFKLIPFFSSFLIALCCLVAVMAGFFILSPIKQVSSFPLNWVLAIVTIFFFAVHIRDLKDVEGDRANGVKTVPVLFGTKIVGIFIALSFLLVPVFGKIYVLFITAIPASIISYYFVNKKPYSEKPIFLAYFTFVVLSFLLLKLY